MDYLKNKLKNFDYKWIIAGTCFLMIFSVLGFCSSSKSLFVNPITDALDIPRSIYSVTDSFRYVTTAIVNIFFGFLINKLGTKILLTCGFISLAVSQLLFSFADDVVLFYIGGIFLGAGLSWTTTTMVGSIVNKWFHKNRGTVMGVILSANGLGAAAAMQILSPIIYSAGDKFGYRLAYRIVAILVIVVGIIVIALIKNGPKTKKEIIEKSEKPDTWHGIEFSDAVKKPFFYGVLFSIFTSGMLLQGISGVAAPLMYDVGIDHAFVATVLSAQSIALTLSKFSVGFLYDRIGLRKTSNICYILAIICFAVLLFVSSGGTGMALAMVFGIFSAFALPLETVMLPIYAMDIFGNISYNQFLGLFVSVNTAGYAVGAPLFNLCYDITGTYTISIYIAVLLMIISFVVMQLCFTQAKKYKQER